MGDLSRVLAWSGTVWSVFYWALSNPLFITARHPSRCHYRSGTVGSVSTGHCPFPFSSQRDVLQDAAISSSLLSPPPLPWLGFLKLICIHVCKMTLTATWVIFQGCWHGVQEWNCVVCLCQALSIPLFLTARCPSRCCYFQLPSSVPTSIAERKGT